jgi:hypothetical protein
MNALLQDSMLVSQLFYNEKYVDNRFGHIGTGVIGKLHSEKKRIESRLDEDGLSDEEQTQLQEELDEITEKINKLPKKGLRLSAFSTVHGSQSIDRPVVGSCLKGGNRIQVTVKEGRDPTHHFEGDSDQLVQAIESNVERVIKILYAAVNLSGEYEDNLDTAWQKQRQLMPAV